MARRAGRTSEGREAERRDWSRPAAFDRLCTGTNSPHELPDTYKQEQKLKPLQSSPYTPIDLMKQIAALWLLREQS